MRATSTDVNNARLRTALVAIATSNQGVLNPRAVLEVARDPAHILHDQFEWNDEIAGEAYRLAQVGALIRRVKLHIVRPASSIREAQLMTTRAFQSRPTMRSQQGGYESIDAILKDERKRMELLAQVLHELSAYRKRYSELSELQPIWTAVDEAVVELDVEPIDRPAPAVDAPSPGAAGI